MRPSYFLFQGNLSSYPDAKLHIANGQIYNRSKNGGLHFYRRDSDSDYSIIFALLFKKITMKIANNSVVTLNYQLNAGLPDAPMQHIESTDPQQPFRFLSGAGGLIQGFEDNLMGLQAGDQFDFKLSPADAYGESDHEAVVALPIDIFKHEGVIDMEILKVDNIVPMRDNEGRTMNGRIVSFNDQIVTVDFNHPLAGHALHFAGVIVEVREATTEEISHGHVH
jgi:FKBP-type peptidyl-prolyl cis-trans isomerase SlyD